MTLGRWGTYPRGGKREKTLGRLGWRGWASRCASRPAWAVASPVGEDLRSAGGASRSSRTAAAEAALPLTARSSQCRSNPC